MHHMDCECTCVCVLLGGDPGTPVEHEFSGLRRFWKVQRNGHTHHHPLSVPVELEVVPMTCWAVLVSKESASELFQPGVTLMTELLTERAVHGHTTTKSKNNERHTEQHSLLRTR